MDVQLPDGTVLRGVPDGTTKAQLVSKLKANGYDTTGLEPAQAQVQVDDPGVAQSILIGAGRTVDRVGKGMQQLYYGATRNTGKLAELKQAAADDDAAYKNLQEQHPFATGVGEALPSMVLPAGGGATLLQTAGRMAASGALPGMLEYGDTGERLKRGVVGAAAGAAVPVVGVTLKTAKSFAEPLYKAGQEAIVGRTLNRVSGDDAANVLSRLKSASPLVPGSMPTAAQVAENGGIAALERSSAQAFPSAFAQRGMEQASARLNALMGIAGDASKVAAAESARDSATKGLYSLSKSQIAQNTPELAAIIDSIPSGIIAKAQALAKLGREPLKIGTDIPAHVVDTGLVDAAGNAITNVVPAQSAQYSGKALHYIKLAIDDALGKTGEGALGNTEKRLMTGAKDAFLNEFETQIPSYGVARAKYAELSKPVNQMEIGQALYDKLKPALSDFGQIGAESKNQFANALRSGDKLAADITGMKSARLASVMTPQQISTLNNIGQDLARKANAETLGKGVGSDTFQKLAMQNIAEQSGMPRLVGGLLDLPGVSRATKWVYRDTDEQAQKIISEAMLNPQKAAQLMEAAKSGMLDSSPRLKKLLLQGGIRSVGLLGMGAVTQE